VHFYVCSEKESVTLDGCGGTKSKSYFIDLHKKKLLIYLRKFEKKNCARILRINGTNPARLSCSEAARKAIQTLVTLLAPMLELLPMN
jgi:hypothetical protein